MTRSQRRTLAVLAAALGAAFVLVWATATGPAYLVGERLDGPGAASTTEERDDPEQSDDQTDVARGQGDGGSSAGFLVELLTAVCVIGGLWALAVLTRVALTRLQRRLPERSLDVRLTPLPDLHAAREALADGGAEQRAELASGDVRNAIVRCWVRLEADATAAGVSRHPAETTGEFVVRLLHALDVDPRHVGALAGLYREARFSSHPLGEDVRRAAESALDEVHRDLRGVGAPRSPV